MAESLTTSPTPSPGPRGASPDAERGRLLRTVRDRAARRNVPVFAMWELTRRCPLKCRHCYLAGEDRGDELGPAETKPLLEAMGRLGVLFLTFTGGEPLLRDDFFDIVDEALALGFAWRVLTSGWPLDTQCARSISERAPVAVDISLHGLEKTHDALTGVPGSWRAAVDAIERVRGLDVTVNAKMNLTPAGLKDLPALQGLCDDLGATLHVATWLLPTYGGTPPADDLVLAEDDLREYFAGHEGFRTSCFGRREPPAPEDIMCGAGRSSFSVSSNGDVRACLTFRNPCGNVRATPLREIWDSGPMDALRGVVAGSRESCRDCDGAEFCSFCPGLSEREAGDPAFPAPSACREAFIKRDLALAGGDDA